MELGDKKLIVQRASVGARSIGMVHNLKYLFRFFRRIIPLFNLLITRVQRFDFKESITRVLAG